MTYVKFIQGPNQGHHGVVVKSLGTTSQVQIMTKWDGPPQRQYHPTVTEPTTNFEFVGEDEYKTAMLNCLR